MNNSAVLLVKCSKVNSRVAMKSKLFLVLVGLVCFSQAAEENYCDPTLCEDGLSHTACDHYLVRLEIWLTISAKLIKRYL